MAEKRKFFSGWLMKDATEKRMDPKKQFSKWLARYGAWFWGIYLILTIGLMYFRPETANACIYLVIIVTANKIVDTIAYTRNSTMEKLALAALDKVKMEISLKSLAIRARADAKEADADEEEVNGEEETETEGGVG